MKTAKTIIFLLISSLSLNAQVSGNRAYANESYNSNYGNNSSYAKQKNTVYTTDSTLVISARILLNKIADSYLISVGLNQEAKTVVECNQQINQRIESLVESLSTIGVKREEVYTDFISQTKVYDYTVENNSAQQFEKGFEIKKNLIIKLKDIHNIDQLIELCAAQEIYDIIKVDYLDLDTEKTYRNLFETATSFIESRKELYLKSNPIKLSGAAFIKSEKFYSIYPNSQYKTYQAFESSNLNVKGGYNKTNPYIQKEARKNKTFYYNGVGLSGFDKIINIDNPMVGIQYILELSIVYERSVN